MSDIVCRIATKHDLPEVLCLYALPDLDDGNAPTLAEAEAIFERMARYPDYHIYVTTSGEVVVGTFALLIMDNLGHLGAPSAVVEDVATAKGCYKLALSSNLKRERAPAFYESLGFEHDGYSFRGITCK